MNLSQIVKGNSDMGSNSGSGHWKLRPGVVHEKRSNRHVHRKSKQECLSPPIPREYHSTASGMLLQMATSACISLPHSYSDDFDDRSASAIRQLPRGKGRGSQPRVAVLHKLKFQKVGTLGSLPLTARIFSINPGDLNLFKRNMESDANTTPGISCNPAASQPTPARTLFLPDSHAGSARERSVEETGFVSKWKKTARRKAEVLSFLKRRPRPESGKVSLEIP